MGNIVNGPSSGEKFVGNIWWPSKANIKFRNFVSLAQWADSTGQEKWNGFVVGKEIDPLLKGPLSTRLADTHQLQSLHQFQLQPNSPITDQGFDLKKLLHVPYAGHDFYNNKVPQGKGVEPGIYERN